MTQQDPFKSPPEAASSPESNAASPSSSPSSSPATPSPDQGGELTIAQRILRKAHYAPLIGVAAYGLVLALALVPAVQRELVFLHRVRYPFFPRYDNLAYYGIAPYKGRNVYLETPDGEKIGAWHILPHSVYVDQRPFPPRGSLPESVFDGAFAKRPTVLYLHGNAATRAAPHRIRTYMQLSANLDCNVVAIDYRGFAESTGVPSQEGVILDARTAWDWIAERVEMGGGGPAHEQIIILAHSLGTGVACALTAELADQGVQPRALGLIAPFTSIPDLLSSFWLFGIVPLLTPLSAFPGAQEYLKNHIVFRFDSVKALSRTHVPTLLLHASDDDIIPAAHSQKLFDSLLEPNGTRFTGRMAEKKYDGWGTIRHANRRAQDSKVATKLGSGDAQVVWWEGEFGGHENLGHAEGSMDLLAWVGNL